MTSYILPWLAIYIATHAKLVVQLNVRVCMHGIRPGGGNVNVMLGMCMISKVPSYIAI